MATTRRVRSNDDLVVAGAGADGHGVMCGFRARETMTRSTLIDLARRSGIDDVWFPPTKDPKVQLTRAMRAVASKQGLAAEQEKKKNRQTVERREFVSRWMLVSGGVDGETKAGAAYGKVALVATLYDDERAQEIVFEPSDSPLAVAVKKEFDDLTNAELYQASDVSAWLNRIHRDMLGGVRYGAGWYVPRAHRSIAEAITAVFWGEARYGEAWMDPPLPVASSAQLQRGIANGLIDEVAEQLALLENARRRLRVERGGFDSKGNAVALRDRNGNEIDMMSISYAYNDKGELIDIGARAAETFAIRFARVGRRVDDYAQAIGDELVAECKARIGDAMIELDNVLEGGATKPDGAFRDLLVESEEREEQQRAELAQPITMGEASQRERDALSSWWTYERTNGRNVGNLASALATATFDRLNDRIIWRGETKTPAEIWRLVD